MYLKSISTACAARDNFLKFESSLPFLLKTERFVLIFHASDMSPLGTGPKWFLSYHCYSVYIVYTEEEYIFRRSQRVLIII